jgi:hypothetical protein
MTVMTSSCLWRLLLLLLLLVVLLPLLLLRVVVRLLLVVVAKRMIRKLLCHFTLLPVLLLLRVVMRLLLLVVMIRMIRNLLCPCTLLQVLSLPVWSANPTPYPDYGTDPVQQQEFADDCLPEVRSLLGLALQNVLSWIMLVMRTGKYACYNASCFRIQSVLCVLTRSLRCTVNCVEKWV